MGKVQNIKNLPKEDIVFLYNYLTQYETELKSNYGHYDFKSSSLDNFCKKNKIIQKSKKNSKGENYFWFEAQKPQNQSVNDIAHHLLRHIRNSIAHALVSKQGKYYLLQDYNRVSNQSMGGKIRTDLLPSFIDAIINTKT